VKSGKSKGVLMERLMNTEEFGTYPNAVAEGGVMVWGLELFGIRR